jgi:hypothetical protein
MLRDDDLDAALVKIGDDSVAVEGLVGDQRPKGQTVDERRLADRVEALPGQQDETHELPGASVRARILVVMPPLERPMAWL